MDERDFERLSPDEMYLIKMIRQTSDDDKAELLELLKSKAENQQK